MPMGIGGWKIGTEFWKRAIDSLRAIPEQRTGAICRRGKE